MGISFSSNRRRNNTNPYYHHPPVAPAYPYPPYISDTPYPAHPPPPYPAHPPPPPYPSHSTPYPAHPPPPPPPPPPIYYPNHHNACNYANPFVGRPSYSQFYTHQPNGWPTSHHHHLSPPPLPPPPPYVEHQQAKKIKNDVNVHKDTIRLEVDEHNPDHHLVSFVFDALLDGSITIFYFAKEEPNCKFTPLYPEAHVPIKVPFQKGLGQRFRQPSGTGIDLGFFIFDDLSKPSAGEDVFPIVISAETWPPSVSIGEHFFPASTSPNMQITQAVLEKNQEDPFKLRVIRQILWVDGVRYELREIYGMGNMSQGLNTNDSSKDCVICMTEPKDTAVLPCRHMCMCSECAKELRFQSNKCPICRQPIEELLEIKIDNDDQ